MQDELRNSENLNPEISEAVENVACEPNIPSTPQPMEVPQKSNLIAGLVGAFLGSLIGCVLWVLIYKLGFIAGLAGAVTAICAMKGYEMFGKTLDKKGVICSILIVIIAIFLANKLAWSWEIYDVFKADYDISFFDAFLASDAVIAESDLVSDYYIDLLVGYALTIWASYKNVISAFKNTNR